MKMRRTF